jgi:hypothetical protein
VIRRQLKDYLFRPGNEMTAGFLVLDRSKDRLIGMIQCASSDLLSRPSISRPFSGMAANGSPSRGCGYVINEGNDSHGASDAATTED